MVISKEYPIHTVTSFSDIGYRLVDPQPKCIGYHHHDGFELMQVWSDSGTMLIDEHIYPLKRRGLYLINASMAHCTNPSPDIPYVRSKITFMPSILIPTLKSTNSLHLLDLFTSSKMCYYWSLEEDEALEFDRHFKQIATAWEADNHLSQLSVLTTLLHILIQLHQRSHNDRQTQYSSINKAVLQVMDYINDHIHEPFTMDDLCGHLHFSKYYLCHTFKSTTGVTILQYMNQQRVNRAKNLLLSTDDPMSHIAHTLGYGGHAQFTRTFKKLTGMSPSAFRKSECTNTSYQIR